jgi:hypothetical protein
MPGALTGSEVTIPMPRYWRVLKPSTPASNVAAALGPPFSYNSFSSANKRWYFSNNTVLEWVVSSSCIELTRCKRHVEEQLGRNAEEVGLRTQTPYRQQPAHCTHIQ